MHRRFLYLQAARAIHPSQIFTPWATALLRTSERFAHTFDVEMSDEACGTVFKDGRQWIVDLDAKICSCYRFQDTGIPCGHAVKVIYSIRRDPRDYMLASLTLKSWVNTYSSVNLRPLERNAVVELRSTQLAIGNISGIATPEPPMTVVPRGRPATKRKRKGDARRAGAKQQAVTGELPNVPDRAPPRCSICNETGHYAPKCRKAHS
jgi:hypothetical protein